MNQKTKVILILLFIFLCSCGDKTKYDLAIRNINLFDSETGNVLKNKTILISSDTIASIINSEIEVSVLKIIEGNNRFTHASFRYYWRL